MNLIITNRQIRYILLFSILNFNILIISKLLTKTAVTGGWISITLTAFLFLPPALIYMKLASKYNNNTLYDYSLIIVGKPFTKIISTFYFLQFLLLFVLLNVNVSAIITIFHL